MKYITFSQYKNVDDLNKSYQISLTISTTGKIVQFSQLGLHNYNHKSRREYYQKNKNEIRKRDNTKRFMKEMYKYGGFCWICGNIEPGYLTKHHVFGKDNNFIIHLCANCHYKYYTSNNYKNTHQEYILRRLSYV